VNLKNIAQACKKNDLIIITPKTFVSNLNPLAVHKKNCGINTKIIKLDDIYNGKYFKKKGRDKPELTKYFIKESIENWNTKYVMLVGDISKMPIRETHMWDGKYITDLYYSDIYNDDGSFSSWDVNNNNKFGQYHNDGYTDDINLKPDVGVGRLACRNKREVSAVVRKIINYETNTYGQEWFKRIISCGGNITGQNKNYKKYWRWVGHGCIEGEHHAKLILNEMKDFEAIGLYESSGNLNRKTIINNLNKGAGFAFFSGHGYVLGWFTKPENSKPARFAFPHNYLLHNSSKLPIIFFDGCYIGKLDLKLINTYFPCFAWQLVSKKRGGGIATMGACRPEFTGVLQGGGAMLGLYFFKAYNESDKNCVTLSDVFMKAQKKYLMKFKDRVILQSYNLLGDPSLRIGGYPTNKKGDNN
jgi:hypothetical protein